LKAFSQCFNLGGLAAAFRALECYKETRHK